MEIKIRTFISIIVLGSLLLGFTPASARSLPPGCSQIVPESWRPVLDQVAEAVEESSIEDTQTSQQALNRTSQNLADIRDAQLFITYVQLMKTFDEQGQTDLFEEQKHWLNQRVEKAQASVVSKGGTLASLEYSDAFRQITEERLAELKARLQKRAKSK
jgi:uncharacterized protein YecT (DUF1311 family)